MSEDVIVLEGVSFDFPRVNRGAGFLREFITGRTKRLPRKERWFRALNNVGLKIASGEVVGIMGANGSGKSTILRVIAGIYTPDEGKIRVEGRVTLLSGVGTGFQQDLTGRENMMLSGSIFGFSTKKMTELAEKIIVFSGVEEFIDDPLRTYSSGMRARLGFAIISHLEPDILLLDEVMSVGDYEFRKKSRERIEELVRGDATVVIAGHSISIMRSLCDRVYALSNGEIVTDGDMESAFEYYQSEKE
jgi:ABC-type polysaccharide/polyol phosphate transport system ATPase subunit